MSDLNISHGKMSDFVSFPLFRVTLVMKLRNLNFKVRENTLIFFDKENDVRFDYVLSNSVWFDLSFVVLSKILAISWEIGILNFIKINSFKFRNLLSDQNLSGFFCLIYIFRHYCRNSFKLKRFLLILRFIEIL